MNSQQILVQGSSTAALGPDHLTLTKDGGRVRIEIPYAVIKRVAMADGETQIRILLTDQKTYWIPVGNPTATEAFLTSLEKALPEERDPAGSVFVVTKEKRAGDAWMRWSALLVFLGYTIWIGVAYYVDMALLTVVATLAALFGLVCFVSVAGKIRHRVICARRGITVLCTLPQHPNGWPEHFTFTDTSGNVHHSNGKTRNQTGYVVYAPERPSINVIRQPLGWLLVKYSFGLIVPLGILGLGVLGLAVPYL
ncbi:hypothetical protein [Streptomyces gardneri]|uniref:hypothetical protein n=1 Tax=Streptomyces gardneri TaxID=66892 RepID=UPI001142EFF5|nr:hypothetical protein [Streptomyces gardneri]